MNCQRFREIYADGFGKVNLSILELDTLSHHASTCNSCAQFLEAQEMLNGTLRQVAAEDAAIHPSQKVEQNLMDAYNRRNHPSISWMSRYRWYPAAAIIILAIAAFLWEAKWIQWSGQNEKAKQNTSVADHAPLHKSSNYVSKSQSAISNEDADSEVATEYFPLVPLNQGYDDLQRVRVMLPRSALMQFGLPMNEERSGEPITADLLITEDGTPQAIRFIQNMQ
jgi:hypothetical protein